MKKKDAVKRYGHLSVVRRYSVLRGYAVSSGVSKIHEKIKVMKKNYAYAT